MYNNLKYTFLRILFVIILIISFNLFGILGIIVVSLIAYFSFFRRKEEKVNLKKNRKEENSFFGIIQWLIVFFVGFCIVIIILTPIDTNNNENSEDMINGYDDNDVLVKNINEKENTFNNIKTSIVEEVIFDEEISRIKFYQKVNEIRLKNGKSEIIISSILEKNANECAKLDFFEDCYIENKQEGVNWEIPWHSNVEGCGFAQSSTTNVNCLIKSLEEDTDSETRLYDYILSKDKIGLGIYDKGDSISYSITLE